MSNEKDVFPKRKKRSYYEIMSSLLEYCTAPQKFSSIYYNQRGAYYYTKKLISKAIEMNLLKKIEKTYVTTPKGRRFLREWKNILRLLKGEENVSP